ncbi:MAG: hypothetical protein A3D31_12110 [Candidatus Fluviicola riflensis]|nr:MAG: hypothetical protein CHH17_16545 [Candidatus Fluviicola riflensis]OGS77729.1 MAG: hypothetical protein A3D31_12110 [Candidatus Fluviicola riflensis]OGS84312.1 MAG: hypothetical protein A3E30_13520 [Fluviicola sp. RIFCSPHIGHO2_12_FULL_43_24]OGS84795.1 MAG: hypothetical protein A2724_09045 [Fluviicola sp. RIFCSPHIGHO2_01_FULL_43_53]
MITIEKTIKELSKFSNQILEFNKPVEPVLIKEFENKYGLTLPNDYKFLLETTNGFSLIGTRVLGLHGNENIDSLEMVYKFEHFEVINPQPTYLIPFCNDGRGNFYCFDTLKQSKDGNSCSIVFWQSDIDYSNQEPEIVNENLSDWIDEVVIQWTLEDYDYDGNEK